MKSKPRKRKTSKRSVKKKMFGRGLPRKTKKRRKRSGKGLPRKVKTKRKSASRKRRKLSGKGLLNTLINKLPFEMHIPGGYQYCGLGTKLEKRLKRNDPGINELDRACKEHDIAYANTNNMKERHKADKELTKRAWKRVKSRDASLGERAAALGVSGIMKAKSALGMGLKRRVGGCLKPVPS